ncbi:thiolase domain-containing protein [Candidatus Peribacteria bacterium]|nr:thiolase domain-containing protein [Candidatus Peribacteria bacterium]
MRETVYVLGGGQTRFGELWGKSLSDLIREAVDAAIMNTNILPTDIDMVIIGNMVGGETAEQAHLGTFASSLLPHHPPALRVEAACASGGLAIHTACAFLESGKAETILVIGAEKLTDVAGETVTSALMHAGDAEKDGPSGLTFPSIFALTAAAYMHKYGLTREDLSLVSECSHRAAIKNPYAQFRKEISAAAISKSPLVADPLRLLDCSPISDGAAAVILSTRKESSVHIAASQLANESLSLIDRESLTSFVSTRTAFSSALKEANWNKNDIDAVELHDCFSIASLIHLEDFGFAQEGEAIRLFRDDETEATGSLPINCSGGLKACGHPIGATGVKQVLDCWKQLTMQAPNQVVNAKRMMAHNLGGVGATCTVHLLESI